MTLSLLDKVISFGQQNKLLIRQEHIVIGCSGGPDSLCLLHLYQNLATRFDLSLTVAHLNHNLRPDQAQEDEDFVRQLADQWALPFVGAQQDVRYYAETHKQSIEEAARQLRYAFLWRVAIETNAPKIAVGHHADDQTETVLMHLLRGTGLAGLRGMLPATPMNLLLNQTPQPTSQVQLIRPLLDISRREIEAYCHQHNLKPREDISNKDTTFFRNRLRHDLIPHLETYNPNIRRTVQKLAKIVAADVEILQAQVEQAGHNVINLQTRQQINFDLEKWLALPRSLQRATLRRAMKTLRSSIRDIGFDHVETAISIIENKKNGAKVTLPHGLYLQLEHNQILIFNHPPQKPTTIPHLPHLTTSEPLPLNIPGATQLSDTEWQLTAEYLSLEDTNSLDYSALTPWEAYLDAACIGANPLLRIRQPGDVFSPLGLAGHHKKIKSFMSDEKIPSSYRNSLPLFVADDHILWVCGYRLADRAKITSISQLVLHLKFERLDSKKRPETFNE